MIQNIRLTISNCIRYLPLLGNLISRELKKKYRRSMLGYVWCVLNPLLTMIIMNFVFSNMFSSNIENFPVYLFVGRMFFSFITDSTNSVSRSIISNGPLMRKTRIPYYIFPLANFCSAVVNFGFTLIAFVLLMLFTRTPISIHVLAFPVVVLEMFMFCFGFGLFLAQANVFVGDVDYVYAVFTTAWMYLTPLFYPLEALPVQLQTIITTLNPAYFFIQQGREIFLQHIWPSPHLMLAGFAVGLVFLVIGLYSYTRSKDRLILYV